MKKLIAFSAAILAAVLAYCVIKPVDFSESLSFGYDDMVYGVGAPTVSVFDNEGGARINAEVVGYSFDGEPTLDIRFTSKDPEKEYVGYGYEYASWNEERGQWRYEFSTAHHEDERQPHSTNSTVPKRFRVFPQIPGRHIIEMSFREPAADMEYYVRLELEFPQITRNDVDVCAVEVYPPTGESDAGFSFVLRGNIRGRANLPYLDVGSIVVERKTRFGYEHVGDEFDSENPVAYLGDGASVNISSSDYHIARTYPNIMLRGIDAGVYRVTMELTENSDGSGTRSRLALHLDFGGEEMQ